MGFDRVRLLLLYALAATSMIACLPRADSALEVFSQSGNLVEMASPSGVHYTISFYPDGLIRSFRKVATDGTVIRDFCISRTGTAARAEYRAATDLTTVIDSLEFVSEAVLFHTPQMTSTTRFSVEPSSSSDPALLVLQHVFVGKVYVEYGFEKTRTTLSLRQSAAKFEVRGSANRGALMINGVGPESWRFEVTRHGRRRYDVVVKNAGGGIKWRLQISGKLSHATPQIAAANHELLADGVAVSVVLWPFLGGCPAD